MSVVVIESPFGTRPDGTRASPEEFARNKRYLKACARDAQARGETWFASHAIYPTVLDDATPEERKLGIEMGFKVAAALKAGANAMRAFYLDLGETPGMILGRNHAQTIDQLVEERHLGPDWDMRR